MVTALRNLYQEINQSKLNISLAQGVDLVKTVLSAEQVSFYGEPLQGLQVMGILETRTLDFDTVIMTTVNEGVLPSGKSNNSFIPNDIRRYYQMPVHTERDAIYAYHFYRLLQRARNIHLIYNNTSSGLGGKEQSRFIRQMLSEWKSPTVTFFKQESSTILKDSSLDTYKQISKTKSLREAILRYLQKGISPTAMSEYVRNPLNFYFERILNIRTTEELEETIGHSTLGSVIHDVLEELYLPFVGSFPGKLDFERMRIKATKVLEEKFKEYYKHGQLKEGKNLLVFQVAQSMIKNFLKIDELHGEDVRKQGNDIEILSLEEVLEREVYVDALKTTIKIKGKADRIERVANQVYIIDYKTGFVDQKNLQAQTMAEIFRPDNEKEKLLQLLMYAYLYKPRLSDRDTVFGAVFSLRKYSQGFIRARMEGKELIFDRDLEHNFERELLLKICEMYSEKPYFEDISVNSLETTGTQT